MSFKSKQRAKHGHLFGDDPLSASLVSTSDDPLFGPKKTTTRPVNKSGLSVASDPLSRLMNNESSPLETTSTPVSSNTSRHKANGNSMTHSHSSSSSSHNGSIFGDIDVSKLGTGTGFSGSKKVNSTSLRSSATLKSSKLNLEEEEDLLFGGYRHSPSKSKLLQKSTIATSVNTPNPSSLIPSPVLSNASPSPLLSPVNNSSTPSTPKKSPVLSSAHVVEQPKQTNNIIPKKIEQSIPTNGVETVKKEQTAKKEEQPTVSSSTSSFFRFFKSSNQNSKTSSSASSAASAASDNTPSTPTKTKNDGVKDATKNNITTTTTTNTTNNDTNILPIPRETVVQTSQPKSTNIYKNIKQIITKEKPTETEEVEEDPRPQIILDEATRAFAEDDLFTSPKIPVTTRYDFRSLSPELTMDALTMNDNNKKLNASISTPTRVDDPWSEIPNVNQNFTVEPSMSSPLVVKVQDIEPEKRTVFADLIQSWNTGNPTNQEFTVRENDPDTFYDHIAEERRDVGFAGIGDKKVDNNTSSIVDWDVEEDNPWN